MLEALGLSFSRAESNAREMSFVRKPFLSFLSLSPSLSSACLQWPVPATLKLAPRESSGSL